MSVKIVSKEYKKTGCRYYLEITLSDYVDSEWQQAYQEAVSQSSGITVLNLSGAPTLNRLNFIGNLIRTNDFPEFAMSDVPDFLKDLEVYIEIANKIYDSKVAYKKQLEEAKRQREQEEKAKLAELNKKLNS